MIATTWIWTIFSWLFSLGMPYFANIWFSQLIISSVTQFRIRERTGYEAGRRRRRACQALKIFDAGRILLKGISCCCLHKIRIWIIEKILFLIFTSSLLIVVVLQNVTWPCVGVWTYSWTFNGVQCLEWTSIENDFYKKLFRAGSWNATWLHVVV